MVWNARYHFRTGLQKDTKAAQRSKAKQAFDLPPWLILYIADFVPTSSAACLALCNHRLSQIVGRIAWKSLRHQEEADRLAFLCLLSKDLPQYFACHKCVRLHQSSAVSWPRSVPHLQGLDCVRNDVAVSLLSSTYYKLRFAHIQLAMKRHHYGFRHGFPLEAFSHTEVELDERKDTTTLLAVDARIVSNELLVRSQQWVLIPRGQQDEFVLKESLLHICVHTYLTDRLSLFPIKDQLSYGTRTWQCPKCHIDFLMGAVDFGQRGTAMVVTRWINLGAGNDAMDAKWLSHLYLKMPDNVVHQSPPADSIRVSFESQDGLSWERFNNQNIAKLFSRRKPKMVTRGFDGFVWRWRYPESRWWYISPSGPV